MMEKAKVLRDENAWKDAFINSDMTKKTRKRITTTENN